MHTEPLPHLHPLRCLAKHVEATARETPDAPAMGFSGRQWTYAQLQEQTGNLARWLVSNGLRKGDRVATVAHPRPEFLVLFLATGLAGGIWVGVNPRYSTTERRAILEDALPRFLALQVPQTEDEMAGFRAAFEGTPSADVMITIGGSAPGATPFDSIITETPPATSATLPADEDLQPDDPALLVYTSGSTGRPKGALISHYGLTFGSLVQATQLGVPRPRVICNLPISHVGCVADVCAVTLVQSGYLEFKERFFAAETLITIEEQRITTWVGVPSMFQLATQNPRFNTTDLSSVKLALWGGAAMSRPLIEQLQSRGLRLKTAYGLTESSCHVTFTSDDASTDMLAQTIGCPTRYTPCRVMSDTGTLCAQEAPGELQIHGRQNFIGYFGNPEATRDAFTSDGWLKTGDIATWTSNGDLRLVGRSREMYKSGGYAIFPREIELVLEAHPAIASAAVVSIPDDLYQEVGVAFVVTSLGHSLSEKSLRSYLKERLANYKIPKSLCFLTELPTLPIGKVDRPALRAQAKSLVGQPGTLLR